MIGGYKYNMGQGQEQASKQSQLVDQNYANGTFFMAMSTIEQIERAAAGLNKGPKEFGKYDHYDYAWKDYQQLKNQLKTQISLVHISIVEFDRQYQNGYNLPKNYDLERVMKRLEESKNILGKDRDMVEMCTDLQSLVRKQYQQINSYNMSFDQEKDKKRPVNPQQYVNSAHLMHEEKEKFLNQKNP